MEPVALYISAPIASFRVPLAREYFETLPCPPPSTVYGMLLSLVGESDRFAHSGAELTIALLAPRPDVSLVLRTLWRVKDRQTLPGLDQNKRPDYQELLTGVRLAVWLRPGAEEAATPTLAARVDAVLRGQAVDRFGGLALGESTHLVDDVRPLPADLLTGALLLAPDTRGDLALPIWPDHVGSAATRWGQYRLREAELHPEPPSDAWTVIAPVAEASAGRAMRN